jgi:putative oxidoreductase
MAYGLLLMRVAIGGIFFAHGTQKLFGWWGGGGLKGTAAWLQGMGFHAPDVMSLLVALGESGGILFALGLLTPFAALGMASAMVVAIAAVHWPKGFWSTNGGYEFNLALLSVAVGVAATGPGRFSLDRALGWDDNLSGVWWGVAVLVGACAAASVVLGPLRSRHPAPEPAA